jgi:hypothetical protein
MCSCRYGVASAGLWSISRHFQILTWATKVHRKGCPLSKSSQQNQTHTLGVRTIFAGRFLAKALELSLGLTRGAGGYSVASSIRLRTLLRDDSPAFQLFDMKYWDLIKYGGLAVEDILEYITDTLLKLKVWFSEGKASPNDINIEGKTILQVSRLYVPNTWLTDGSWPTTGCWERTFYSAILEYSPPEKICFLALLKWGYH